MVIKKLFKKSSVALLSASLILGSLLISSNANASASASVSAPAGLALASTYTLIDSGYGAYRTLGPYATESFQIKNTTTFARAYQVTVSSSASSNVYPSSINFTGQGRIYYLSQQPGLYVYDIIVQPNSTANIDVTNSISTANGYVISVY